MCVRNGFPTVRIGFMIWFSMLIFYIFFTCFGPFSREEFGCRLSARCIEVEGSIDQDKRLNHTTPVQPPSKELKRTSPPPTACPSLSHQSTTLTIHLAHLLSNTLSLLTVVVIVFRFSTRSAKTTAHPIISHVPQPASHSKSHLSQTLRTSRAQLVSYQILHSSSSKSPST